MGLQPLVTCGSRGGRLGRPVGSVVGTAVASSPGIRGRNIGYTIGFVALAVGAVLLFFAFQGSNAPVDQVSEALTGRYTGNTMWYLLGGLTGTVAGGALLYRSFSRG